MLRECGNRKEYLLALKLLNFIINIVIHLDDFIQLQILLLNVSIVCQLVINDDKNCNHVLHVCIISVIYLFNIENHGKFT